MLYLSIWIVIILLGLKSAEYKSVKIGEFMMKNLMLAMCCLVLLEGCKSSKKMEKQPAPKKTMAAAHKKAIKKPMQKSTAKPVQKSGMQKSSMKNNDLRKPAAKAGAQKAGAQKSGMKKPVQKSAQKAGMHKAKKSDKDKAVVQSVNSGPGFLRN